MRPEQRSGISTGAPPSADAGGGESLEAGDLERSGYRRAAWWALAGALMRAAAYFLPWVIAEEGTYAYLKNGQPVDYLNGSAVGAPVLSIGFSLVAAGVAVTALVRRDKVDGLWLRRLGVAAIGASIINLMQLFAAVGDARDWFMSTGLGLTPSVGPWAQLAGAFGIYAGGVMAVRVQRRFGAPARETETSTPSMLPPPPPPATAPTPLPPVSRPEAGPGGPRRKAIAIGAVIVAAIVLIPLALNARRTSSPPQLSPSSIPTPTAPPAIDLATGTPAGWTADADGSSYQVSVMHDGYAGDVHLRVKGSPAWTRDWLRIAGAPVIADGLLFAGVVPGRAEGRVDLVAVSLRTGAPVWRHDIGDAGVVGLALDHGRLFALAADGTLWAFDAATGHLVWRVAMPQTLWYTSPPTAAGGVLYVAGNGTLYAVDQEDGVIAWKQGVAGDTSPPTLFATSVVAGYACFQVPTFDTVTGKAGWNHTADCSGGGGLASVYYDGRIYARYGSEGLVLDARDGREVGRFTSAYTPAFYDGIGYFVDDGILRARDLGSFDVIWSVGKTGGFVCAPIIAGGTIYIGDRSGDLVAIDRNGQILRRFPLTPPKLLTSDPGPVALNAGDGALVVTTLTRLAVFH